MIIILSYNSYKPIDFVNNACGRVNIKVAMIAVVNKMMQVMMKHFLILGHKTVFIDLIGLVRKLKDVSGRLSKKC